MSEEIVNPKRYTHTKLECWDFWVKAGLNPLVASAVKYVWRYKYKNGLEDLKKAEVFLTKAQQAMLFVYCSEKNYELKEEDVKDGLDETQILFLRGAIETNTYSTYYSGTQIMEYALNKLIEEYYKNND